MRYILPVLLGGFVAFSAGNNHRLSLNSQPLDTKAISYDKNPRENFKRATGSSLTDPYVFLSLEEKFGLLTKM